MTKRVTDKQYEVLDAIRAISERKGYGPTVREICDEMGLTSPSTVHVHLKSLVKKGMITRDEKTARSIILTDKALEHYGESPAEEDVLLGTIPHITRLPLVGDVAAGTPILAEQNIVDAFYLPTDIVTDAASFMLKVHGDSMIEAGINDGDYVVVREQKVANNGDIVVALVDDGATVKRFYLESDHIRLQPENSSMEPIILGECELAGKVVAVFRRL